MEIMDELQWRITLVMQQVQRFLASHTQLFFTVEPEVAPHDYELAYKGDPE